MIDITVLYKFFSKPMKTDICQKISSEVNFEFEELLHFCNYTDIWKIGYYYFQTRDESVSCIVAISYNICTVVIMRIQTPLVNIAHTFGGTKNSEHSFIGEDSTVLLEEGDSRIFGFNQAVCMLSVLFVHQPSSLSASTCFLTGCHEQFTTTLFLRRSAVITFFFSLSSLSL